MKRAMNGVQKSGTSKRRLLISVISAGLLTAGALGINAVWSAEPDTANAVMEDHGWHGGRCDMLRAYMDNTDKKLTAEQVRDIVAGRLAQFGEGTLKVGKVTAKEPGVVAVDIVTTSGSLVTTREISTKTGRPTAMEKRCEEHGTNTADNAAGGHDGKAWEGHMMGHHMHGGMRGFALVRGEPGHDLNLSADQVKKLADAALILTGNPRLKVGAVKEKDANTVTVDIVTVDNALVFHREVDRHTGHVHRAA